MRKASLKVFGILAAATSALVIGCTSSNRTNTVSEDTKVTNEVNAAADMDRSVVSSIKFEAGQNGLSPEAASEVQRALADARKMGQIKTVEVVTWSDMEYPTAGKALPRRQINLADDRAKNVEKLVDQVAPDATIKKFNMAKQPNAFQKWLDTRDSEVKQKLMNSGVSTASANAPTDRASSALLFIEVE